jgi:hypothetical protein
MTTAAPFQHTEVIRMRVCHWLSVLLLSLIASAPAFAFDWVYDETGVAISRTMGADGSAYLLSHAAGGATLTRVAPQGHVTWRQTIAASIGTNNRLVLVGDRVHVGLSSSGAADVLALAFDAATGTPRLRAALPHSDRTIPLGLLRESFGFYAALVYDELAQQGAGTYLVRYDALGNLIGDSKLGAGVYSLVTYAPTGAALLSLTDVGGATSTVMLGIDGALQGTLATPAFGLESPRWQLLPDGGAVAVGRGGSGLAEHDRTFVVRTGANGSVTYRQELVPAPYEAWSVTLADDTLYIDLARGESSAGQPTSGNAPAILIAADVATGTRRWRRDLDASRQFTALTSIGSLSGGTRYWYRVHAGASESSRTRVQIINTQTGEILRDDNHTCGSSRCVLSTYSVDTTGVMRIIVQQREARSDPYRSRVFQITQLLAPLLRTRADQPGVRGAWAAPYMGGQGFVLDYEPVSRTLFMPWFTFGTALPSEIPALRWYTLQGTVARNATSAVMTIFRNSPGAFAAAPATTAEAVGSATLTFSDCDHAELAYAFTDGGSGTITLSRLTAQRAACTLADGSIAPATTVAPSNGFDARQSGSWIDTRYPGQGVEFEVAPGNGVFAAWFTYDPAGAHDDANHLHWFTLQAPLAGASSGRATMTIYRTTGGLRDAVPASATLRVGDATVTFTGCDRATLRYRFDDTVEAALFRELTGSLDLQRLGGCQ